ncbi:MAG TPA: magnesium/cobalt transporter CorA [Candidatus Polarisedimenticolia bacterium]|nr:magnesium/cobalt transporter CorA [Candidatus Polarisedimenticolia bacterium]
MREGHAPADLPALLGRADRIVWVDLATPSREETAILSSVFHFHPLAIDDCTHGRQNPKVEDFKDYLFILTHGVHPEASIGEFKTRPLSLFVGRSYIVSFHREKSRSVQHAMESARHNPKIMGDGPDSILYNVLDYQVDQYLPVLENFEKKVDEVEGLIFTSPTEQVLTEVLDFKKALMRLRRISGHQRDTLLRLVRREFPVIDERAIFGLRDVADHLVRIADLSDTYREQIADALAAHLSIVSNRTNEIMRVLTVIATIFIPLTFIVGVYGMNFDHMPELHWRYGYLGVWVVMLLVVAAMAWFFRRRGLFGGRS